MILAAYFPGKIPDVEEQLALFEDNVGVEHYEME
jgi:hypothetical protein